jgi:hypothetical protein
MLQNNSNSMETVVETFYVSETINLVHDNDALQRWNEKVEELDLKGQKEVIVIGKSPIPFLWMNQALISTFETLCPTKIKINEYNKTPIPLELLETVSLCNNEKYFDLIEVWYNEKDKDPVIIGYSFDKKYPEGWTANFYANKYLIGRWADVKASLDNLTLRAKELFFLEQTDSIKQSIKNYQRQLEDLEITTNNKFGGAMPLTNGLPF